MALDLAVIAANWRLIALAVVAYMVLKCLGIYAIGRLFQASHREAVERAVLMAQGGEFAFVLYAAATSVGIIDAPSNAILSATIIVSMALTPLLIIAHDRLMPKAVPSTEGVEAVENLSASVLMIGFGRFGQIVSQPLLGHACSISLIEIDPDLIRDSRDFGFKVYYGDGTRLDILHAAGAAEARLIIVAVNDAEAALKITELVKAEFPLVPVLARAIDREHAAALLNAGVDFQIRETFESALTLADKALAMMDVEETERAEVIADVRRRDAERLSFELTGGLYDHAARSLILGNLPLKPAPSGGAAE